jgi:hypothetical protein
MSDTLLEMANPNSAWRRMDCSRSATYFPLVPSLTLRADQRSLLAEVWNNEEKHQAVDCAFSLCGLRVLLSRVHCLRSGGYLECMRGIRDKIRRLESYTF